MNNVKKIAVVLFFAFSFLYQAQDLDKWKRMDSNQRKEYVNKLTPEQRKKLHKQVLDDLMVQRLELTDDQKKDFSSLYQEYQQSQRAIKKSFRPNTDFDNMTEQQAQEELEKSFEIGQQLMDNRKKYIKKFQKVIKPQQVLKMFEEEGKMRDKMMDRKRSFEKNDKSNYRRPSSPSPSRRVSPPPSRQRSGTIQNSRR